MELQKDTIILYCPHCGEPITSQELEAKNAAIIQDFLNQHLNKELEKREALIKSDYEKRQNDLKIELEQKTKEQLELAKSNFENDKKAIILDEEKRNSKAIENLNKEILDLKLEKQKELNSAQTEKNRLLEETKEKYSQQISKLNESISELKLENEKTISKTKDLVVKDFEEVKRKYISQIEELKAINNSFENQKKSEIEILSQRKEAELVKLKNDFEINKNNFENTINSLNEKLENINNSKEKDIELEKIKTTNEVRETFEKQITELNNEINLLKIANDQNRLMNNKIKGENFETEVHGELNKFFTNDLISKITDKGDKADFLQSIKDIPNGSIAYEVKNAEWKETWEGKLKDNMSKHGAKYGIIVASSFNDKYPGIPFKQSDKYNDVYLAGPDSFIFVGQILSSFIKKEYELATKYGADSTLEERINKFNKWKQEEFNKAEKDIVERLDKIAKAEKTILNGVETITKQREKILTTFTNKVIEFVQSF